MSVLTWIAGALPGPARREAQQFAALLDGHRPPAAHHLGDHEFNDLEALVGLARGLAPSAHAPSPLFRSALRERLVAEAATRTPTVPVPRGGPGPAAPTHGRPRLRSAVAAVVLAAVVTGAGAAAASTRALPGDVLYGLKRQIESAQLALAGSDLDRGREHLEQADERLGEVETLAASSSASEPGTRRWIATTLGEMERATDAGATELTASYAATGEPEPMRLLGRFAAHQRERLDDLVAVLDPSLRARVQAEIAALDRVAAETRALLGTTSAPRLTAEQISLTARDGWAVSRISDRSVPSDGTGTTAPGAGDTSSTAGPGVSGGELLGTVADVTGGGTSATSSPRASPGLGGGTASVPPVGTVVSPPPTLTPLPTATPLPTSVTSPLPSVTCVPLPPLTTC